MHNETRYLPPSLEWLRAFVAFAEHLSFTHAARALHLSQPALHVQVRKLSEQLGVALYRKRGRALELTAEGTRTLAFAREILERSERFAGELHAVDREQPTILAAGEGAFLYLLGEAVRAALAKGAALRTLVRDAESTVEAVESGEAHLGVAALDEPPRALEHHRIARSRSVLVVRRDHALAERSWVRIDDLASEPLVLPPATRPQRTAIDVAARAAGVELEVAVEARGWPLTLRFVELGIGAAIVNDVVHVPRGLVAIPLRGLPAQSYWAFRRRGAVRSRGAEELWMLLAKKMESSGTRR